MASRIKFEDDIIDTNLDETGSLFLDSQHVSIKKEKVSDQGNVDQGNINDCGMNDNKHITPIMKKDDQKNDIQTNNSSGKNDQVKGKIDENNSKTESDSEVYKKDDNEEKSFEVPMFKGNIGQNVLILGRKPVENKGKKRPSELDQLGINVEGRVKDVDICNMFGDDDSYKKYNLRKSEQQVSYKDEPDWKPKRRISSDEEPTSLECPNCDEEFENKVSLNQHLRVHNRTVKDYTCSLCSQKFDKNSDLIAHKSTHNKESFLCEQCKLAFSDHCDYLLHNILHTSQTYYKCPECGLRFKKHSYRSHIVVHFAKKIYGDYKVQSHDRKITCVECGKICKGKSYYDYHLSTHTGVKKHQCLYCGRCFSSVAIKRVHTRIHTGDKPYTCEICGHKSSQSGDMKRHKVTHEIDKKFTCDVCNKKFFYKTYMIQHMRAHMRSNLYACPECDSAFQTSGGLKVHVMYKHMSDRPVECKLCDKQFINNNQYRKHCRAKYHQRNIYGQMTKKENRDE